MQAALKMSFSSVFGVLTMGLLPAHGALAATHKSVEKEIQALVGQWEGEATDGTKIVLTVAAGQDDLVGVGTWKVEGSAFAGEHAFSILHDSDQFFMVPGKTMFSIDKDPAYTLDRLPGGGLKFVRLAVPSAESAASLQSEEIEIGRLTRAGKRNFKLLRGERLCFDEQAPGGKSCGEPASISLVMHKITP